MIMRTIIVCAEYKAEVKMFVKWNYVCSLIKIKVLTSEQFFDIGIEKLWKNHLHLVAWLTPWLKSKQDLSGVFSGV